MNFAIPSRSGHTLPELLTVLGIAAILATAAVPLFSVLLLDSRMNAVVATAMERTPAHLNQLLFMIFD